MELTKALYAPAGVAAMLDVDSATIMNWIHAEKLYALKLSERTYRIPQREAARRLGLPVNESRMVEHPGGGEKSTEEFYERVQAEHFGL